MKFGLSLLVIILLAIGGGIAWLALVDAPVAQQEIVVNVPIGAQ